MKRIYLIILSLFLTLSIFAQSGKDANLSAANYEIHSCFNTRKEKGFYNIMQVSLLFGNNQLNERRYPAYDNNFYTITAPAPVYYYPDARNTLNVAPSLTISNGYMFNKHWAAGAGVGYEIFDHNLFPLFAELRYTLKDYKISPFMVLKGGYSFGGFKAKQYDKLYLNWSPYNISDATLRHYGGLMVHPEIGVKIPLSKTDDLLFTAAYRFQKTKSVARKEYDESQFEEWEHNEKRNRLSFGVAIMFR